jgi:hypothetical protein
MRMLTTMKIALVVAVSGLALDAAAQAPAGAAPASAQQGARAGGPANPAAAAAAKRVAEAQAKPTPRDAKGKPVLVGFWAGPVPGGPSGGDAIRKPDGSFEFARSGEYVSNGRRPMPADMPKYKPQYRDLNPSATKEGTVDYADANQPIVDSAFLGAPPGIPRIGPPHAITQIGDVLVFLYHDLSGPNVRMIPIDGRKPRDFVDPSYNGESVGRWEGDTLVVESSNFVENTWLGERGYIHGDKLKVVERITRKGDALTWVATATDPDYLLEPWTTAAKTVVKENEIWEEVPPFRDIAAPNLVNTDNHAQR